MWKCSQNELMYVLYATIPSFSEIYIHSCCFMLVVEQMHKYRSGRKERRDGVALVWVVWEEQRLPRIVQDKGYYSGSRHIHFLSECNMNVELPRHF